MHAHVWGRGGGGGGDPKKAPCSQHRIDHQTRGLIPRTLRS